MLRSVISLVGVYLLSFVATGGVAFAIVQVTGKCKVKFNIEEEEFYCEQNTCTGTCTLTITPVPPHGLSGACSCG